MSWEYDMAKVMKMGQKQKVTEPYYLGQVVEIDPLTISILDGEINITEEMVILTRTVLNQRLEKGDRLVMIGSQKFLVLDKV